MNIYYLIIIILFLILIIKNNNEKYVTTSNAIIKENFNGDDFNVYLIHMAKNKDRLTNFNNYHNNSDLSFKKINIFPAIVGRDLNLINFVSSKGYEQILMTERTNKRHHHYDLTRGAVGCYLSHLSIYKKKMNINSIGW